MKYRRRRYIVDTGFQGRFVIGFVTATLMGSVAASVFFNLLAVKRLEELRWSVFITAQSTGEVLRPLFIYANLFSFIFVSVLFIITMAWMLKRANGPLYRIIKDLKLIEKGDFSSDIILRQQDEFGDVAAALNRMLQKIRARFSEFKTGHDNISQALIGLEVAYAKGAPVAEDIKRIINMIQKMQKLIPQDPIQTGE